MTFIDLKSRRRLFSFPQTEALGTLSWREAAAVLQQLVQGIGRLSLCEYVMSYHFVQNPECSMHYHAMFSSQDAQAAVASQEWEPV